jgi:transcriptional regulator with XRE-family HTH domain
MSKRVSRSAEESAYLVKLGEQIRAIRQKRGFSQEEFAHRAGFSRSYYTEIETGKRNVSILNLVKIADNLEVRLTDLTGSGKIDS